MKDLTMTWEGLKKYPKTLMHDDHLIENELDEKA